MQCSVLKMINKNLRIHSWRFNDDTSVTDALLQFAVHTYRNSQQSPSTVNIMATDRQMDAVEREFIFSLARKLGVTSLAVFSDNWQCFLSCKELQQLVVMVADKHNIDDALSTPPPPQLMKIIMEFYECRLHHDDDACLLLTKYIKPGDDEYTKIVEMIVQNAEHYDAGALFHLAQLQASNRRSRKDVMDSNIFNIITKAFETLKTTPSSRLLDYIDWVFAMCTSNRREPARSPFYSKLMTLVCSHGTHTDVVLRVLQRIESHASLMKHSTATELGHALVARYREHFLSRFRDCGHAAYASIISEMIRARLECRHYVKNGEVMFDTEVIEVIRRSHQTKKKLMKLLSADFPEHAKSTSC